LCFTIAAEILLSISVVLFGLIGVVNSLKNSFVISLFEFVFVFNNSIVATAVAAVCCKFNGEPAVA